MKQIHYVIEAVLAVAIIILFIMMPRSSASKSKTTNPKAEQAAATLPIAFVRMDSLASQYEYYRDINKQLAAEAEQNQRTLATKMTAMQKAAEDFQRRLRINAFTSEDAARAEQEKILKMQEEGQRLELSMTQNLANKQAEANDKMYRIVREQVSEMNKDGKYRYILTNVGLENLLYADSTLDITDDVVKFLNDHYRKEIKGKTTAE
ncbi:membrane protein [Porphyromonas gulae]|uniref:Membrane protein n=1 Tax=Porphyromonas gulae TaxID=111105 RepID=A0A0A2GVS2_9PORP|nr:OmpH family outer membrane protein [Porphyromonas gulae]KGN74279.1 membrane protein [Porphyromonas gulae]KGN77975.1 membrane protein [Porphyromonas gulae]KGN83920.1 membrane protein [Porphyromonas gulae]KGN86138.1 membrane protein [Porphyromonas gulae]KGO04590.1 membrane protein [Porphyromonas gulae]